ncbi:hypothetical protein HD598_001861 [Neomicrococcus aestuarii]|uniref:Uncharacterized protein n=1 Tax=Neomicrococcus aestuarii TaxID=556325 RepID=A0A7W8TUK1_9MICC|nr:hypothetical protein [Neomicrococcus aestuarii]MBB5513174.1 hypothetical protein [Neomicrococcus aestuarii]
MTRQRRPENEAIAERNTRDSHVWLGMRLILPALWLGLIIGISLIEAPLKFQAPGITIPLGLGIGRLVFGVMNTVEFFIFAAMLFATIGRGVSTAIQGMVAALGVVQLVKVIVVRPQLNHQTDLVLSGASDGGSLWHYAYIACDGVLILLLIGVLWAGVRSLRA